MTDQKKIDDGGFVSPIPEQPNYVYLGLTKREYFAAMAMQGFVVEYSGYVDCNFERNPEETAKRAVAYADALIAELNKGVE